MSLLISRFSSQIPPNEKDYLTPIGICHSSLLSMPTLQNYYFCNLALFQFYAYFLVIVISECIEVTLLSKVQASIYSQILDLGAKCRPVRNASVSISTKKF